MDASQKNQKKIYFCSFEILAHMLGFCGQIGVLIKWQTKIFEYAKNYG
jgi:hypothetical protein